MGQGGNVWEWMETAYDGTNNTAGETRELRGGSWDFSSADLDASSRGGINPTDEYDLLGFRVASVPEPSTGLLVVLGLSGLLLRRRK
jgi:formylglycine-generating enzyme required for sulfatase activity